jgi:hypothetical protein
METLFYGTSSLKTLIRISNNFPFCRARGYRMDFGKIAADCSSVGSHFTFWSHPRFWA